MVRKKMVGDEDQKREMARDAKSREKRASEVEGTTGSSKQRNEKGNEKGKPGGNRGREEHD